MGDSNNQGLSIVRALGNFQGGKLKYWPNDPGPKVMPDVAALDTSDAECLNVHGQSVVVDSTKAHEVEPFEGKRFSIVYFTIPTYERSGPDVREFLETNCGLEFVKPADAEDFWHNSFPERCGTPLTSSISNDSQEK